MKEYTSSIPEISAEIKEIMSPGVLLMLIKISKIFGGNTTAPALSALISGSGRGLKLGG